MNIFGFISKSLFVLQIYVRRLRQELAIFPIFVSLCQQSRYSPVCHMTYCHGDTQYGEKLKLDKVNSLSESLTLADFIFNYMGLMYIHVRISMLET